MSLTRLWTGFGGESGKAASADLGLRGIQTSRDPPAWDGPRTRD